MIPALLKWIGNKQRFAETIVSYMPYEFNRYFEPFLGSGAVLAELLYQDKNQMMPHFSFAYGSDILPFLIDVFRYAKDDPDALIQYYQDNIEQYYNDPINGYETIRARFNKNRNGLDFCLLSRTCYSGIIRFRKTDGYMSTPRGPHTPIDPETFSQRVQLWHDLLTKVSFSICDFRESMNLPQKGDVVYCDPPYTHSQKIIYGAQSFDIDDLWTKVAECKDRGAYVMLSINCMRESKNKDISIDYPKGLFKREILISCGISMIDRLQNSGKMMTNEQVYDKLLLTW